MESTDSRGRRESRVASRPAAAPTQFCPAPVPADYSSERQQPSLEDVLIELRETREQMKQDLKKEMQILSLSLKTELSRSARKMTGNLKNKPADQPPSAGAVNAMPEEPHWWVDRNMRSYAAAAELAAMEDSEVGGFGSGAMTPLVSLLPDRIEKGSGPLAKAAQQTPPVSSVTPSQSSSRARRQDRSDSRNSQSTVGSNLSQVVPASGDFYADGPASSSVASSVVGAHAQPVEDVDGADAWPSETPKTKRKVPVLQTIMSIREFGVLNGREVGHFIRPCRVPGMWRPLVLKLVRNKWFDYTTMVFIMANALAIGIQTDYCARHAQEVPPVPFRNAERVFSTFFITELALRIIAFGKIFFTMPSRGWNILDFVVVSLQILEEAFTALLGQTGASFPVPLTLMRMLRILRLVRIVRVVRLLRYLQELRTLVVSLMACMKPLLSTIVLLLLVVYIVGCYFTQLTLDYRLDCGKSADTDAECHSDGTELMIEYYGSLGTTMMHLFESVTNGIDWKEMVKPLIAHIGVMPAMVLCGYIVFTSLALMNIVTGVFVETALMRGREDRDLFMINHLKDLFGKLDDNHNGAISWTELEDNLHDPRVLTFFKDIDIDISEAKGLFHLLDRDGSGVLDADEFLSGCLRLRGPAKSLDMQLVMCELAEHRRTLNRLLQAVSGAEAVLRVDYNLVDRPPRQQDEVESLG